MKMMVMTVVMMTMTLRSVSGHGRLVEPPSRSSMWRYGFNTPHNYDDNALNCGGLNVGTFQTAPLTVSYTHLTLPTSYAV